MRIVNTDNFGGDYPNETFLGLPNLPKDDCDAICEILNRNAGEDCPRYWKTVEENYILQPGFEP